MIKIFILMLTFVASFKSRAHVPFTNLKGMHEMVVDERFSPVYPFAALNGRVFENIRFFGPYVLDPQNTPHPQWIHPAFLIKKGDDPHAFSKRFEYPLDAVTALIQWLFPSVDGMLFVANDRSADPVGFLGKNLELNPTPFAQILSLIKRYSQTPVAAKKMKKAIASFKQEIRNIIPSVQKKKKEDGSFTDINIEGYINNFAEILYHALLMDGTFGTINQDGEPVYAHNPLYPKHIALHGLLGYMWRICNSKAQVIAIMREAELLKPTITHKDKFIRAALDVTKYTRDDYESIKEKSHPTFEELAFAGYGYEIFEKPNPEMIIYSNADIAPTEEEKQRYPYLKTHHPYPDCGETALRNLFNLVAFKGAGEFDGTLLPHFDTPHMGNVRKFYQDFPNISSQKHSSSNTAWSTIVSNLNETPNSLHSENPMDVRYDGYTNIKASLGMKNILNVIAKLTGDPVLNEIWRTGEAEKNHIAQKLTRLCKIFSRGEHFKLTWEVDGQTETASLHKDFKLTISRRGVSYDFIFSITPNHFAITTSALSPNDWRKVKLNRVDHDLLKPFYDPNSSPFLNPLIREQQDSVLRFWRQQDLAAIPLTLRFLYKNFGSVTEDENAQISIMRGLGNIDRTSPLVRNWVTTLLIDKLSEKDPDNSAMFQYEFSSSTSFSSNVTLDKAVKLGLKRVVEYLIRNPSLTQKEKNNFLRVASENGQTQIVEIFLMEGADKDERDPYTGTPLTFASKNGHAEVVQILLKAGANKDAKNSNNQTPLMVASGNGQAQVAKILLNARAKIEAKNKYGSTPLILASREGHAQVATILLNAGAEIEAKDKYGSTPLMKASIMRHAQIVEILLKSGAEIDNCLIALRKTRIKINTEIERMIKVERMKRHAMSFQSAIKRKKP